ncbi:MAG: hypothetical protein ABI772_09095 [Bacteroidota bacterium]
MKKHYLLILTLALLFSTASDAQRVKARWKAYRFEWSGGIGASNFLGELGGANQVGTNGFKDLEFSATRQVLVVGLRYKITPFLALHGHASWATVSGDDALTEEPFRKYRNLNFRSPIFEVNCNFEASVLNQKEGGLYRLRGIKRSATYEVSAYAFAGIGVFHFNPKGQLGDQWVALQPLGTEGQGISPARTKYKLTQVCIPVGFGFRYFFNRRMGIGLEYGLRKTFTDYIDDVSKTYYDNAAIAAANGPDAAAMADKSGLTALPGHENQTNTDQQRGDPRDKDAYMFAVFSIHYKLRTGRTNFPIF